MCIVQVYTLYYKVCERIVGIHKNNVMKNVQLLKKIFGKSQEKK